MLKGVPSRHGGTPSSIELIEKFRHGGTPSIELSQNVRHGGLPSIELIQNIRHCRITINIIDPQCTMYGGIKIFRYIMLDD